MSDTRDPRAGKAFRQPAPAPETTERLDPLNPADVLRYAELAARDGVPRAQAPGQHRLGRERAFAAYNPVAVPLSAVAPRPLAWVWPGWIPEGMLTVLGGHVGDGKSTLMAGLIAALSTGRPLPDGAIVPPKTVLILGVEDDPARILRPRLDANGADPARVFVIEPSSRNRPDLRYATWWFEDMIEGHGVDLIVIDPLGDVLRRADRASESNLREELDPLMGLAARAGVAVVGVIRVPKSGSLRRPAQSLVGSSAIPAIARSVLMIAPASDPDAPQRSILQVVKSNASRPPRPVAVDIDADGVVSWVGPVEEGIDERAGDPRLAPTERRDAAEYLRALLAEGPVPAAEAMAAARKVGFSEITVRRAKKDLGVRSLREPRIGGSWKWALPDHDDQ